MFEPSNEVFFSVRKFVIRMPCLKMEPSMTRFLVVVTFSRLTGLLK